MMWRRSDSILPPEWHIVQEVFGLARILRERVEPFAPMVVWRAIDGESGLMPLMHKTGELPNAIEGAIRELITLFGDRFSWISIVTDAYGRVAHEDEPLKPEELGDLFVLGDQETVEQLMVVHAIDGDVRAWRQVYRHTDLDGWEWDDPEWMAQPVLPEGGIWAMMEEYSRYTIVE